MIGMSRMRPRTSLPTSMEPRFTSPGPTVTLPMVIVSDIGVLRVQALLLWAGRRLACSSALALNQFDAGTDRFVGSHAGPGSATQMLGGRIRRLCHGPEMLPV